MGWDEANDREHGPARERRAREPEAEHGFWVRYWEVLRAIGVRGGGFMVSFWFALL